MQVNSQRGFTLLEIVIFVLIVGFLVAGALKGQEMITSARVKRLAGQLDEIRAATLGFQDRYKALPGDYSDAVTNLNCGSPCPFGNGDSRIRANETPLNGSEVHEDLLAWTHLASSGLLKGDYRMNAGDSVAMPVNSPTNPFGAYMQIAFDGQYGVANGGTLRHNLKSGPQITVQVLMELDRKVDDGKPYSGIIQFSTFAANGAQAPAESGPTSCTTAQNPQADWNLPGSATNCGVALLM
jgi:type II secretory pathway pseudopilin PulG